MLQVAPAITNVQQHQQHDTQNPMGSSSITHVGVYDVLCGRDKEAFNNIGNRRFRVTVSLALDRYTQALTRKEKSTVIHSVAVLVQQNGGRFLHKTNTNTNDGNAKNEYTELNEKQRHDKVGHALRDMALAASKLAENSTTSSTTTVAVPPVPPPQPAPKRMLLFPTTTTTVLPEQQQRPVKRQKLVQQQQQQQPMQQNNNNSNWEDPTQLDSEALRILSSAMPQLEKTQQQQPPLAVPASLDVDDSDTILSWLMEESDQVLGFDHEF